MAWKTREDIPLDEKMQVAVSGIVAKASGVEPMHPGKNGEMLGYVPKDKLAAARTRIGTCGGTKGNIFSEPMIELFYQSNHIVMCWFQDGKKRSDVAAMAVNGFTFAQADEMSNLAKEAGCVLKPDAVNVLGEQWILFETE